MISKLFPWGVVILAAAWVLPATGAPSSPADQPQIYAFARIPVVDGGRVKPMDTIARTHLRIMSNRETFRDDEGPTRPAIEWLLDIESEEFDHEGRSGKHPVFRIDHPQLQNALGLQPREGFRYSIDDFRGKLQSLAEPLQTVHHRKEENHPLDAYETQLFEFERHLGFYFRLSEFAIPHVIPPKNGKDWETLPEAKAAASAGGPVNPDAAAWDAMRSAYGRHDTAAFNASVAAYLERLERERPSDLRRAALEVRFNSLDPFNKAKWLYLACGILAFSSWLGWRRPLNFAAWGLLAFTFLLHAVALGVRMHLSGRPPVTNLYSSAVFIGCGCVLGGLLLAQILRILLKSPALMSIGTVVGSAAGFLTLQIAHILAADGDTMEVLQAVLDTQFWLATHVTCITLGYTTTYLAGFVGLVYIIMGVFTRALTPAVSSALSRVIYGIVCFAIFFSFIGTVLGGLWADDSWGRFWGWDPKENGALMIVLWNALFLHARWGGLVRGRGIAMLSVFGNIVVSWSWFGVNQLGVGLHSYGFTSGVLMTMLLFMLTQVIVIGFAFTPTDRWKSALPPTGASEANGEADA